MHFFWGSSCEFYGVCGVRLSFIMFSSKNCSPAPCALRFFSLQVPVDKVVIKEVPVYVEKVRNMASLWVGIYARIHTHVLTRAGCAGRLSGCCCGGGEGCQDRGREDCRSRAPCRSRGLYARIFVHGRVLSYKCFRCSSQSKQSSAPYLL